MHKFSYVDSRCHFSRIQVSFKVCWVVRLVVVYVAACLGGADLLDGRLGFLGAGSIGSPWSPSKDPILEAFF